MKISNIFTLLLAGFALAGATSCVEKVDYEPAEPVSLAPYYFSTANGDYENLEEGQTSVSLLLGRLDAKDELTVNVAHSSEYDAIFNVPSTVTFAAGESTAYLEVTFDIANVEKRKEYKIDFELDGIQNTPYYLGDLSVTMYYNPWEYIGKGIYTDVFLASIFSDLDPYSYEVDIQEHPTTKGYYRVVNPYSPNVYPQKIGDYDTNKNSYVYINAEDPEGVYVETSNTGLSIGNYGTIMGTSKAYQNMQDGETLEEQKEKELTGYYEEETKNIVIADGLLLSAMSAYQNGQFIFDSSYEFRLVLPGGKVVSDWEEIGFCSYTDGFCGPFLSTPVLDNTYEVMVEYNPKTNFYRILDPFGPNSGYVWKEPVTDSYIYFDVNNPECVTVGQIATTMKTGLRGRFFTTTDADVELETSQITKEELADAGIGGKFDGKVITIPGDQICGFYQTAPKNLTYAKTPVDAVLDLSNPTPQSKNAARKITKPLQLRK